MKAQTISLNNLSKTKTSYRSRVGRGIGSGKGKTSGRGIKGQKARTGHHSVKFFEGGQTPIHVRIPKRGFVSISHRSRYEVINIYDLVKAVVKKNFDTSSKVIDKKSLEELGLIKSQKSKVKLIMSKSNKESTFNNLKISVDLYSQKAKQFAV